VSTESVLYILETPRNDLSQCSAFSFQKPDGLIFPDRATLYICAIEDRQYKDEKINCEFDCRPFCIILPTVAEDHSELYIYGPCI